MNQHDDEPREEGTTYKPFMPGQDRVRPNRAERRAREALGKRSRRRARRATMAAVREVGLDKPWKRDEIEDHGDDIVSLDLETGSVNFTSPDVATLEEHL